MRGLLADYRTGFYTAIKRFDLLLLSIGSSLLVDLTKKISDNKLIDLLIGLVTLYLIVGFSISLPVFLKENSTYPTFKYRKMLRSVIHQANTYFLEVLLMVVCLGLITIAFLVLLHFLKIDNFLSIFFPLWVIKNVEPTEFKLIKIPVSVILSIISALFQSIVIVTTVFLSNKKTKLLSAIFKSAKIVRGNLLFFILPSIFYFLWGIVVTPTTNLFQSLILIVVSHLLSVTFILYTQKQMTTVK